MAAVDAETVVKLAHDLPVDEDGSTSASSNGSAAGNSKAIRKTADIKIDEQGVDFASFMLKEPILKGLKKANFVRPSPIQLKAIPIGRLGMDMIVQAKSGTGKTCVFSVLALETVESSNPAPQVLIVAPTREIALQIATTLTTIGHYMLERKENEFTGVKANRDGIKIETFIGGTTLQADKDKARLQKCQIVVGTPGRILQLINEGDLSTDAVRLFVMDESDKLMQDSYMSDVNSIYAHLPTSKQLVVTSATYPKNLDEFLSRYMKTPQFVKLDAADVQLLGVKQYLLTTTSQDDDCGYDRQKGGFESWIDKKIEVVHQLLSRVRFSQCMIFCAFQDKAEKLGKLLAAKKWPADFISSTLSQTQRTIVLKKLQNFKIRVLVSTDITARGIDAENVNLVINFDLPYDAETYFHRIGRAGRFGGYGAAVTLACNHTEEMKFYAMAAQNSFQVKMLPAINEIPSNLADNEQYYLDLPKVQFDEDRVKRFLEKQDNRGKPKYRRNDPTVPKGPVMEIVDEYTKLLQLAGPVERWSPTEFVWEEKANQDYRSSGEENGKRIGYSRAEMLSILKDNLSSFPSSRASVAVPQSPTERESSIPPSGHSDGQGIDVNALFSKFQGSSNADQKPTPYLPVEMAEEDVDGDRKDLMFSQKKPTGMEKPATSAAIDLSNEMKPVVKRYDREELLKVRPLCNRAYAETIFNMPSLDYTFKKKKKRMAEAPEAPPPTLKYPRDEVLAVKSSITLTHACEAFDVWKLRETFDERPQQEPIPPKMDRPPRPPAKILLRPPNQPKPVDIRKDYDDAVLYAQKSPFYSFFGGCALKLQAAAVEARRPQQSEKEVQTEVITTPVASSSRGPGWRTVSYDRDRMLELWKSVANSDWSYKRQPYPWFNVVKDNGLLVDRYGEPQDQAVLEEEYYEDEDEEEEEGSEDEKGTDKDEMRRIIDEYKQTLEDYRETLKLYKKFMAKQHI